MAGTKHPNVAGLFYPEKTEELQNVVNELLNQANPNSQKFHPKAIISPHAGYIYSGPIAASVYKTLLPIKDKIKKVVLLGPAHRVGFFGIAIPSYTQFTTPLGNIDLDQSTINKLTKLPSVKIIDRAFDGEHCLEVQLPFLQSILTNFEIVPILVGSAKPIDVANLILNCWGDDETLIVISSDLSHYYDYPTAQILDQKAADAILNLEPEKIADNQACGRLPIKGLLIAAKQKNMHPKLIDLRNSGDTAGDKNRVVGYGAFYFV